MHIPQKLSIKGPKNGQLPHTKKISWWSTSHHGNVMDAEHLMSVPDTNYQLNWDCFSPNFIPHLSVHVLASREHFIWGENWRDGISHCEIKCSRVCIITIIWFDQGLFRYYWMRKGRAIKQHSHCTIIHFIYWTITANISVQLSMELYLYSRTKKIDCNKFHTQWKFERFWEFQRADIWNCTISK